MVKLPIVLLHALPVLLITPWSTYASPEDATTCKEPRRTIIGKVSRIEGDYYTVQQTSGRLPRTISFKVKAEMKPQPMLIGEQIKAEIKCEEADSITKVDTPAPPMLRVYKPPLRGAPGGRVGGGTR